MVSINLLKDRRYDDGRGRRRSKAELFAGGCVLASVCAFWGWGVIDVNDATQRLEQEMQEKQERVALLQNTHREVLTLEERRQAVLTEHDRLKTSTKQLAGPIHLLSMISRLVDPLDVWLLHLQADDEKITLSGFSHSLEDVVKLAKDFEKMLGPVDVVDAGPHDRRPDLFQFSMNVLMDSTKHG
ncbi:MAG: hypothetical protein OXB94_12815 [Nitrospira sp.]|nr:hypothetical protein [Nitrospira sp.]